MDSFTRAPAYDRFKLIVAIVLLILALVLLWRGTPSSPASTPTPIVVSVSPTSPPPTATTSALTPTMDPSGPTWTPFPPSTETSAFQPTATPPPPDTPAPEPSPTPIAPPTATPPPPEPSATPIASPPPTEACAAAVSRSRLQVGTEATILRRLNFRSSPGIRDNRLFTNLPGTRVRVVGGPECTPYWIGAYLWWQIELPDGRVGWSAEGSLRGSFYFMEPR